MIDLHRPPRRPSGRLLPALPRIARHDPPLLVADYGSLRPKRNQLGEHDG